MLDAPVRAARTAWPADRPTSLLVAADCLRAILFLVAFWLLSAGPGAKASDGQIMAFCHSASRQRTLLGGLYVMPLAAIAFIWFLVALQTWIAERSAGGAPTLPASAPVDVMLWTVRLVSGSLYVALFLATAVAFSATWLPWAWRARQSARARRACSSGSGTP
jgi:hypothetical protein